MQLRSTIASAALLSATALSASIPSSCSVGSKATATAQADLDKYAGCAVLVGNLTISGDLGSAALANVQELDGSLTINNATDLVNFSADSLKNISGSLTLEDLTILESASFASLEKVDSIQMQTLPAISTFSTNLQSANNIYVSDTMLETVDGFSTLKKVNVLNINNNRYLTSFNSDLESVADSLQFSYNGEEATVSFDELLWANNITLRDVQSASFKNLQSVNASFGLINNSISNISLSKLSKVGQTFSVTANNELTDIDCSNLTTVGGGFVIANNTKLSQIDGFKKVSTIGGAMIVTGNFSTFDVPVLKSVRGDADIETSSSNFTCTALKKLQSKGAIQGDSFICKSAAKSSSSKVSSKTSSSTQNKKTSSASDSQTTSESSSATSSTSETGSSSASSSNASGAAAPQFIQGTSIMGVFAAVAAALL